MAKAKPAKKDRPPSTVKAPPAPRKVSTTIEEISLADLKEDGDNRRAHTPRNIGMIADSLQKVGAWRSISIDENNKTFAGAGVMEAAAEIGMTKVRVIEASGNELIAVRRRGLTKKQKRDYGIYDNRANELSEWDKDRLKKDLAEGLDLKPFFRDAEIASLLDLPPVVAEGQGDADTIPEPKTTTIKNGDVFELGRHRLVCGDSTQASDMRSLLQGIKPDMALWDPPYCSGGFQEAGKAQGSVGTTQKKLYATRKVANDTLSTRGYQALLKGAMKLADPSIVYIFTDWRMWLNLFDVVESSGFGVRNMIVWDKGTPGMGVGWRATHELVMFASKAALKFDNHKAQSNVIQASRTGNKHHATEKPVALLEKILRVTDMAETVIDSFAGSGSTVIACETVGPTCYAMDLDPLNCQTVIDRWEAFTGKKAQQVAESPRSL